VPVFLHDLVWQENADGFKKRVKVYLIGVVAAFANDSRVLGWDVWNEPLEHQRGP
jgi:GH35 family endo-1,4-beta-xylanase